MSLNYLLQNLFNELLNIPLEQNSKFYLFNIHMETIHVVRKCCKSHRAQ